MSNKQRALALLAALSLGASLSVSAASDGAQLYGQHCAKCHAQDGRANTLRGWLYFAQDLRQTKWQDKVSDADILETIQQGPGAMPGYAEKLSEAEQQALVQAVRDLRQP
jgi:mono/diheme cytochrome c family protein